MPLKKLDEATHFLCSCSLGNPLGRDICFVSFCWCLLCVGYSNSVCLRDTFQLIMKVLPSLGGITRTRREEGQEGRWKWRRPQLLSFPFCPTVDKPLDLSWVETGWGCSSLRMEPLQPPCYLLCGNNGRFLQLGMLFPHPKPTFPTYRLMHISSATCTHFTS